MSMNFSSRPGLKKVLQNWNGVIVWRTGPHTPTPPPKKKNSVEYPSGALTLFSPYHLSGLLLPEPWLKNTTPSCNFLPIFFCFRKVLEMGMPLPVLKYVFDTPIGREKARFCVNICHSWLACVTSVSAAFLVHFSLFWPEQKLGRERKRRNPNFCVVKKRKTLEKSLQNACYACYSRLVAWLICFVP